MTFALAAMAVSIVVLPTWTLIPLCLLTLGQLCFESPNRKDENGYYYVA